ncbi:hypothetical protein ACQJBY_039782 [Aegilops geniculata]
MAGLTSTSHDLVLEDKIVLANNSVSRDVIYSVDEAMWETMFSPEWKERTCSVFTAGGEVEEVESGYALATSTRTATKNYQDAFVFCTVCWNCLSVRLALMLLLEACYI